MASSSTPSTSTADLCAQWSKLRDKEITIETIEKYLSPVYDDLWVAAACVDRLVEDPAVQKSLLVLGISRTDAAAKRSKSVFKDPSDADNEKETGEGSTQTEEQRKHGALVSHFREELTDARLCHLRSILLERLDRLKSYEELCSGPQPKQDGGEDEDNWADDPWADTDGEPIEESSSDVSPIPLSEFLVENLLELACLLASKGHWTGVNTLMKRHNSYLWPFRFTILENFPEHISPSEYRDLLPGVDMTSEVEQKSESVPWRQDADWTESPALREILAELRIVLDEDTSPAEGNEQFPNPLPPTALTAWYQKRIEYLINVTGIVDNALSLVQHAASKGVPNLDEVGEDLLLLSRLVYDASPGDNDSSMEDWSLKEWDAMDSSSVIHAYLARSSSKTIVKDITKLVMPYLYVLESRAERAGQPDPEIPTRLLYNYILEAPLELVASIFEASKPTLPSAQRLLRNDEDMARLALSCLYGSDSLGEWPVMSRIFECLPAWNLPQDDDEADEAETTLSSLGTFVTPTIARPQSKPLDLFLFFKPLPTSSLSRLLDVLDVHLESGEILSRWSVPAPLRWFLQSNGNIEEQRAWANRMARRAGGNGDKLDSQEDWEWLLEDMLKLSGSGVNNLKGAFCLLTKDEVTRIFFGGLLASGRFDVAKNMLRTSKSSLRLRSTAVEEICLASSQEFYDNANSGNYHFGDMKLAFDCLDVPRPSERVIREKEFIEATSRLCSFNLMSRPGIPISPIEIRLTKDRLSLISRILSSNAEAYKHTQVILELVHKLGFRGDVVAEVKTLAMLADTALNAGDFTRAYETSETMVKTVLELCASSGTSGPEVEEAGEVCWVTCFQLGRHPEFEDTEKKLIMLGHAMELCPADKLVDILASWRRMENEGLDERRARLTQRRNGNRSVNGTHKVQERNGLTAASLAHHLQQRLHMPEFHIPGSPLANSDAAAMANRAFNSVAANFPFRGRSLLSEEGSRSRSGSRARLEQEVSVQASRVLQKGLGWLLGDDA